MSNKQFSHFHMIDGVIAESGQRAERLQSSMPRRFGMTG
jgi:hypothetical protein